MPDQAYYETLRENRGLLVKALVGEMKQWSEADAESFLDTQGPDYGMDAAVRLLERRARSRHAAARHEAAVADLVLAQR